MIENGDCRSDIYYYYYYTHLNQYCRTLSVCRHPQAHRGGEAWCVCVRAHMHNQRQLPDLRYDSSGFIPQKVWFTIKFEFCTIDIEFGLRDLCN